MRTRDDDDDADGDNDVDGDGDDDADGDNDVDGDGDDDADGDNDGDGDGDDAGCVANIHSEFSGSTHQAVNQCRTAADQRHLQGRSRTSSLPFSLHFPIISVVFGVYYNTTGSKNKAFVQRRGVH